jgi:hypothetical protein
VYVLDWNDGSTTMRFAIPRGDFASLPEITYSRTQEVSFQIEIQAMAADGGAVQVCGVDTNVAPVGA